MDRIIFILSVCLLVGMNLSVGLGCHDQRSANRKKRQASTGTEKIVDETRPLRDFFVACMKDKIPSSYDWEAVVDYTILDTNWYQNSDAQFCSVPSDTAECWKTRLNAYLRNDAAAMASAQTCIDAYALATSTSTNGSTKIVYSRKKRQIPSTSSPINPLITQYSKCISSKIPNFPQNRRPLNIISLIQFVQEVAICGDCNITNSSSLFGVLGITRSKRNIASDFGLNELATLLQTLTPVYVTATPTPRASDACAPYAVFPFRLEALTIPDSPLLPAIVSCNQIYNEQILPDPCNALTNNQEDAFCRNQQSWCFSSYTVYMAENCARTCCLANADALLDPPPVGWSTWSPWGACPAPCDQTAIQIRSRICPLGIVGLEPCVGESSESRVCRSLLTCPGWSSWGPWSACQATCGDFVTATSLRFCEHPFGNCPGQSRRTRRCSLPKCQGLFDDWTFWSSCSHTCGGGSRTRTRECNGYSSCYSDSYGQQTSDGQACAQQQCPQWTTWSAFGSCSVTCGSATATHTRTRLCVNGSPGDIGCLGQQQETQPCGRDQCPPPQWSVWSSWTECRWKKRVRQCVGGPPGSGTCVGEVEEYLECDQACSSGQIIRDNVVTSSCTTWGMWSSCSQTCGPGTRRRERTCPNTRCNENAVEREACYRMLCFFG